MRAPFIVGTKTAPFCSPWLRSLPHPHHLVQGWKVGKTPAPMTRKWRHKCCELPEVTCKPMNCLAWKQPIPVGSTHMHISMCGGRLPGGLLSSCPAVPLTVAQRPQMTPRFTCCLLSLTLGGHLLAPGVRFPGSDRYFTCGLCHRCH